MEEKKELKSALGIKETEEALKGFFEIALVAYQRFQDGVDLEDFSAFYSKFTKDEEFQKVLSEAWEGRELISFEVSNIDLIEGMELIHLFIEYAQKFLKEIKKENI